MCMSRFLDASFQNSSEDIFMPFLDHVRAERPVFHVNISNHCGVVETTGWARHENSRPIIAKILDRAWSLPELSANKNLSF